MKIKLSQLKPNPFKKFINKGKLDEETISKFIEGYKQTRFHENVKARKNNDGEFELVYGHHRIESAKRVYGKNHEIEVEVYSIKDFSDEQMLLDMIRENLTQRGDNYRDLSDSVMLVKKWLESKSTGVKELYTYLKDALGRKKKQDTSQGIGSRQVAEFLAKQGKAISHATVSKVIGIEENLLPELREKVSDKLGRGTILNGEMGTELSYKISTLPKEEQKDISKIVEKVKEDLSEEKTMKLITEYKNAPEEIKIKVREGEIDLRDVPIENLKENIKKKIEEDKKNSKGKITITHFKSYQREAGNRVGDTNDKIIQTVAFLNGLEKSGVLYDLDWHTMLKILESGTNYGKNYTKYMEKILDKVKWNLYRIE